MPRVAAQTLYLGAGATDVFAVAFDKYLDSGELLTGTPTVVEVDTSDLTLGNKAVSTGSLTILGRTVATGKAVQFSASGATAGTTYRVRVTATTDASPARTEPIDLLITGV